MAGNYGEILISLVGKFYLLLKGGGNAIYFIEGIGEMGDFRPLRSSST